MTHEMIELYRLKYFPAKLTSAQLNELDTQLPRMLWQGMTSGRDGRLYAILCGIVANEVERRQAVNPPIEATRPIIPLQFLENAEIAEALIDVSVLAFGNFGPGIREFFNEVYRLVVREAAVRLRSPARAHSFNPEIVH
jgi:hypothetical protein